MTKKGLATFVLATTLIGLTGCAANDRTNDVTRNNLNTTDVRYNNNGSMNINNVSNEDFRVSNRAGRSVEKLQSVELAHVIIRNNDAYVSVRLHNRKNQAGMGTATPRNVGSMSTADMTRTNDITARGAGTGRNGNYPSTTGVTSTDNTGNGLNPGTTNIGGTTGVRDTGINGGANFRKASTHLERDIAHQVHTAEKNVDNVYVSYDTDFFNRLTDYTTDTGNRRNRDGLWNDITNTIRRSF